MYNLKRQQVAKATCFRFRCDDDESWQSKSQKAFFRPSFKLEKTEDIVFVLNRTGLSFDWKEKPRAFGGGPSRAMWPA